MNLRASSDNPLRWPRVHDNEQTKFNELRRGDFVPGIGIVTDTDDISYTVAFENGAVHTFARGDWNRFGFEGVRRRNLIQEQP